MENSRRRDCLVETFIDESLLFVLVGCFILGNENTPVSYEPDIFVSRRSLHFVKRLILAGEDFVLVIFVSGLMNGGTSTRGDSRRDYPLLDVPEFKLLGASSEHAEMRLMY
jgi:hypothetical protein